MKFLMKNRLTQSGFFSFGIVTLILVASGLFLFWPVILGRNIFPLERIGHYHYIYFRAMQDFVYRQGMLPNFWPAYNSGYPINLTLDGFLNPIFILTLKYFSYFMANNLMVLFFFVINGLSFYAFAKNINLSKTASIISSISYAASGVVIFFIDVAGIAALMPFLPLSFLCALKIMQGKRLWFFIWLFLLIYSWIGGWSEMIVYAGMASTLFMIYLLIKKNVSQNSDYYGAFLFLGALILSVIILSPWFLSILYFISQSFRAGGTAPESAGYMPTTFSHLIHAFYPRMSIFYGETLPFPISDYDSLLYIGTLPLILIFTSLFIKNKKEKGYFLFFLFSAIFFIIMTLQNSPMFWLFHQLPVLKWFGGYWKWSFVIVFLLAILAGYGFDNIKDFYKNRYAKYFLAFASSLMLLVFVLGITTTIFEQKIESTVANYGLSHYKNTANREFNRTENYYKNIIEKISESIVYNFSLKNKQFLLILLLWAAALLYVILGKYDIMSREKWKILAIFITLSGSILPWQGFLKGPPIDYLKTEPKTAEFLRTVNKYKNSDLPITSETESKENLEPYRIYLYTPYEYISVLSEKYDVNLINNKHREEFTKEMMDDNMHLIFDFDTFENHQTLVSQRLMNIRDIVKQQKPFSYKDKTPFENYIRDFASQKNLKILGMVNVKYILSPLELKNMKPLFTEKIINNTLPIYIYENPYFMPRWYFAENIKWTDKKNALNDLQAIADFKKTTLLETNNLNDLAIKTIPDSSDNFELELYAPGKLKIKTKTKNYRFLVFSESRQPFWQAKINRESVPLYTANYLFQAILVPPGENIVEFTYPKLLEQGIISLKTSVSNYLDKLI